MSGTSRTETTGRTHSPTRCPRRTVRSRTTFTNAVTVITAPGVSGTATVFSADIVPAPAGDTAKSRGASGEKYGDADEKGGRDSGRKGRSQRLSGTKDASATTGADPRPRRPGTDRVDGPISPGRPGLLLDATPLSADPRQLLPDG